MVLGFILAAANVLGLNESRKAADAQNDAAKLQQQLADNQAANERRKQIRQARLIRGRLENASAQTGGLGSSSNTSANQGINSNLGFNLSESFATQAISGKITRSLGNAAGHNLNASIFNTSAALLTDENVQASFKGLFT